jgi:disulfide bond formation protein DsbB
MKRFALLLICVMMVTLVLSACGGGEEEEAAAPAAEVVAVENAAVAAAPAAAGDPAAGQQLFATTCAACHGPAGEGVQGLGKDMTQSEFIAGLSDEELIAFINVGRRIDDPLNTTGVDMPPKGGNPTLTEEKMADIVAYIRTIHVD